MTSIKKRKLLIQERENSYQKIRDLERNKTNATAIKNAMIDANEDIESLIKRIKKLIVVVVDASENDIKR